MKAEPEVHLCGAFDFVTQKISEFAQVGNLDSAQRSRSLYDLSFSEASQYPGKRTNRREEQTNDTTVGDSDFLDIVTTVTAFDQRGVVELLPVHR